MTTRICCEWTAQRLEGNRCRSLAMTCEAGMPRPSEESRARWASMPPTRANDKHITAINARSRIPAIESPEMLSSSSRACSADNAGVFPVLTACFGPRTELAGFVGMTWPTTRKSKSIRITCSQRLRAACERSTPGPLHRQGRYGSVGNQVGIPEATDWTLLPTMVFPQAPYRRT